MIPSVRYYTLPEANAKVKALEERFKAIESHLPAGATLKEQVNDLEIVWGARLLDADCPGREEYFRYKTALDGHEAAVREELAAIHADGIEVKDLATGLVDFYARRGAEIVLLCWKKGEKEIGFWHTLQGGFAGRKPMREF